MAQSQSKRKRRIALLIIIEVVVLIFLLAGGKVYDSVNKIQKDDSKDSQITKNTEIKTESGYRNIVIFGVDSRENALKEGTNSDTIIIATINNQTKDVTLTSVYRDTYSNVPGYGYDKINAAYRNGGYSLALSTLNTNFDLNLKEYVTVNFKAVVSVIDKLGGITLDITSEELPYLNGYVKELNRINGTNVPGLKKSGTQLVNGTQATAYARIRYTQGADYKRTQRQRTVISKIFDKVKASDLTTINSLIDEFCPQVLTNLSNFDIISLGSNILSYNITDQTGFPFEKDSYTYNRVSYVFPINLQANVTKLHEFLYQQTGYVPTKKVQNYSTEIEKIRKE